MTFAGFGDSTLNFEIRCFLPNIAIKLATTHELHLAIDRAFREADIEIAFPQMDLHIRSVEAAFPIQQTSASKNGQHSQDAGSKIEDADYFVKNSSEN